MSYSSYEWFLKQDMSNYDGKWVAIIDKEIVASGKDVEKLVLDVKNKYPSKRPLITKIRSKLSIL